jgi:hypothetical protein
MDRHAVHAKVDEVFDELEKIATGTDPSTILLRRIMLQEQNDYDGSVTGCILVTRRRGQFVADHQLVTWGISPFGVGLHSGHYDMNLDNANNDWLDRVRRGW